MTVVKSERAEEIDRAVATVNSVVDEVEGEIRAFVRRDISVFRRPRADFAEPGVDGVNAVIERAAGASVDEIERVIAELSGVRDMLRGEGDRVRREISGYASLCQAAMSSMKVIGESVAHWKSHAGRNAESES
jgi:hypothetical protein